MIISTDGKKKTVLLHASINNSRLTVVIILSYIVLVTDKHGVV